MAINETGIVINAVNSLSAYVFGNDVLTILSICIFLIVLAMLIKIPFPFAIALNIPLIVVFTAWGYIPILLGVIFTSIFIVIATFSFIVKFTE